MSNDLTELSLLSELLWTSYIHSKDDVSTTARSEYWDDGITDYVESMKKGWQSTEWMKNEEYE